MSNIDPNAWARSQAPSFRDAAAYDQGLRAYMLGVYNYMTVALLITGLVAFGVYSLAVTSDPSQAAATMRNGTMLTDIGYAVYMSPLRYVLMLAPLGIVFLFAARIHTMGTSTAQMVFWLYSALVGASISYIFLRYTGGSITKVFFITAATFGTMSLYGYTTRRDLSGMGSFLMMGLIGVIIASLVNIFLQSSALQFAVSVIGVLVFVGFTAYDTQQIKEQYDVNDDGTVASRKSIMGALMLYLDFLNIFLLLLSLFGGQKE